MNKIFISLITCMTMFVYAQNPLKKGGVDFNAGFGFSNWGLPLYLGFDYGVHKDVTIGAELSYRSHRHYFGGNPHYPHYEPLYYRHSMVGFLFNGNYHFNSILQIPKEFDFYTGLNIGVVYIYDNYPYDYYYDDYLRKRRGYWGHRYYNGADLGIGFQIGGRYYFTDKFGMNLELGAGNILSGGKVGITIKL